MSDMPPLVLPWPPTGNNAIRHTTRGHYPTPKYKAYRHEVWIRVKYERCPEFTAPVRVHVLIDPPDRRARDLDNVWKTVGDSCQYAGLFLSDSLIHDLHLVRGEIRAGGRVVVSVETL